MDTHNGMSVRHSGEHGITLVELLVVLAVIGIGALIAVYSLSGMYQRSQLEGGTDDIVAFINSVPSWAKEEQQPVFLIYNQGILTISEQSDGSDPLDVLDVSRKHDKLIVDWPTTTTLSCDSLARGYPGTSTQMLTAPVVFTVTHLAMTSGFVNPVTTYTVTLSPLWHVMVVKSIG